MGAWEGERGPVVAHATLKADALGRVERLDTRSGVLVRRVPAGGRIPGSAFVARRLARRERRALAALAGLDGVPRLVDAPDVARWHADGAPPPSPATARACTLREFVDGEPLSRAASLPSDFFEHLAALVAAVHARGVCHNDLHKEQNVLVRCDGRPALVDFQLASVHVRRGRAFRVRVREDLRHVEKHRQRYVRRGRTRAEAGLAPLPRRGLSSALWRRLAKPVYVAVTRGLLRTRDGEERRPSRGPWPEWTAPLGAARTQ